MDKTLLKKELSLPDIHYEVKPKEKKLGSDYRKT